MSKIKRKRQERAWRDEELGKYGISIHGVRENNAFRWL
jgi:hypothetical protein